MAFSISDACLALWGGDSIPVPTPSNLRAPTRMFGFVFPTYRLVLVAIAIAAAIALYVLIERTRLGAMIRAGVDDRQMARAVGIPVENLFTTVFCLGAGIAGAAGVLGGPILSAYPGLDADMLPLALIVVILGGIGSLLGAFVGSFIIGFIYTFGTALFPELAYIILFLPMIVVIAFRPQGLFGRAGGLGFLMITLPLSQVLWGLAYRMSNVTNGDNGIAGLSRPAPFGMALDSPAAFYWFALIVAAFAFAMMTVFVSSAFGSSLKG